MALSDYMESILFSMKGAGVGADQGIEKQGPGQGQKQGQSDSNQNNSNQGQGDYTGKAGSAAGNAFGQGQQRPGQGQGQGQGQGGIPFDAHINGKGEYESLDGTEARESEITDRDINNAIKDALRIGKFNKDRQTKGGGKGNFNREIADRKTRTTQPWKRIMRQMVQKIQYKRSFSRVNSRMAAARVVAPKTTAFKQHSDIIFAIDVSGSMSDKTVENIMNEVLALSRQTSIKDMRILLWDAGVTSDMFVKNGKMLDKEKGFYNFVGGGGTNIDCVYNYIGDKKYEPSGVCYFTDGYIDGDKLYTGRRNDCENVVLITKNGSSEAVEKVKKEKHYTHLTIYQTDL